MKKLTSIILVLTLILAAGLPSFAAAGSSQTLEEAILKVRTIAEIPEELSEFSYNSYERELKDGTKLTLWNLNWNDPDYNESVYAYVDSLGNLVNYYRYNYSDESGLAKVSREAGAKTSEEFLKKALPAEIVAGLRQVNEAENKANTYNLNYTYQYYHQDVPVPAMTVEISVDKYEGYVRSYDGFGEGAKIPTFDQRAAQLDQEQAKAAFLEQVGVKLRYYSYYDYTTKNLTVFPAYSLNSMTGAAIDAQTGELVQLYSLSGEDGVYGSGGGSARYSLTSYDDGEAVADSVSLSPAELAAVEGVAGLMSSEAAEKAFRSAVPGLTADMKLESASLYQNSRETEKYIWDFYFEEAYGEIDAKTGEVLSFYLYADSARSGNQSVSEEKARQTAEEFLKKTAPDKFNQTALSDERESPIVILRGYVDNSDYYVFQYYRQANGIDFTSNSLTVQVSAKSGQIYQYSSNWYDDVSFPSIASAMGAEKAFDILDEAGNFALTYGMTSENTATLVYQLSSYVPYMVDPLSGQKITYNGKAYTGATALADYDDLDGHWSQAIVEELLNNGYYLAGNSFKPDQTITQIDFLRYLYPDAVWYESDDDFYNYLSRIGVVKAEEKNPAGELARKDAAKFLIRFLGLGLAGEQADIYINNFTDQVDREYLGYAALCQGLGIMQGNRAGAFNGNVNMSRAEAASAIYQLLQVK